MRRYLRIAGLACTVVVGTAAVAVLTLGLSALIIYGLTGLR
jgi:hypothetical protein